MQGSFDFDIDKSPFGALEYVDFRGSVAGTLRIDAMLRLGVDTTGAYLDPTSYIGGNVRLQPKVYASLFGSSLDLSGAIRVNPALTFDYPGRMYDSNALQHLTNDTTILLRPVLSNDTATIRGNVDTSITLGFLDYVDIDPDLANTENGGDPFIVRARAGIDLVVADGHSDFDFEFNELVLMNPDVDQDGEEDYTTGAFLSNVGHHYSKVDSAQHRLV